MIQTSKTAVSSGLGVEGITTTPLSWTNHFLAVLRFKKTQSVCIPVARKKGKLINIHAEVGAPLNAVCPHQRMLDTPEKFPSDKTGQYFEELIGLLCKIQSFPLPRVTSFSSGF